MNDPNLIFKDEKGNIQTREWVNELFKKEKVSISQKKNANGKTEMTFYILSEKENEENEKRVSDGIEKLKNTKFPDFNLSTVDEKKYPLKIWREK